MNTMTILFSQFYENDPDKYKRVKDPKISYILQHDPYVPIAGSIDEDIEICTICRDAIDTETACKTICSHLFHVNCLAEWTKNNSYCPICKQNFNKQLTMNNMHDLINLKEYNNIGVLCISTFYKILYTCDVCNIRVPFQRYHLLGSNYDLCVDCYCAKFPDKINDIAELTSHDESTHDDDDSDSDDTTQNIIFYDENDSATNDRIVNNASHVINSSQNDDKYIYIKNSDHMQFKLNLPTNISIFKINSIIMIDRIIKTSKGIKITNSILNNCIIKSDQVEINNCEFVGPIIVSAQHKLITGKIFTSDVGDLFNFDSDTLHYKVDVSYNTAKQEIITLVNNIDEIHSMVTFELSSNVKTHVAQDQTLKLENFKNLKIMSIKNVKFYKTDCKFPSTIESITLNSSVCRSFVPNFISHNNLVRLILNDLYIPRIINLPPNAKSIEITNCNLKKINGAIPKTTQYLNLSYNNLSEIPSVLECMELIELNLYNNKFTTLTLPPNVIICNVCNNKINIISNPILPSSLLEFYCSNNYLCELPTIIHVTRLDCSFNRIKILNIDEHNQIAYLNCNNNKMTNINVANLPSIVELNCDGNRLRVLPLLSKKLKYLNCSKNKLTSLDNCLKNVFSLFKVNCSHNQLTKLDLFGKIIHNVLNCSHNMITFLRLGRLYESNMSIINLSHNPIIGTIHIPSSMKELNIKHTNIKTVMFNTDHISLNKYIHSANITNKYIVGTIENVKRTMMFNDNFIFEIVK